MFPRSKALAAICTLMFATALATGAAAGEHRYRLHRIKHVSIRHVTVNNHVRVIDRSITVIGGRNGLRHRIPGEVNTYSGDVAVYSTGNVGSWSYGTTSAPAELAAEGSTLKIIDLTSGKNDCSMEHGVCVIRP